MKNFQNTIRHLRRMRIRTKYLIYTAVFCGIIALMLLAVTLYQGDFLSASSYIAGFSVQEISDDGECLYFSDGDDESLTIVRSDVGSDGYFRIKKAVQTGGYLRAMIHEETLAELRFEGRRLYLDEEEPLGLNMAQGMLAMTGFFAAACAVLSAGVILRKNRRRGRKQQKNKK